MNPGKFINPMAIIPSDGNIDGGCAGGARCGLSHDLYARIAACHGSASFVLSPFVVPFEESNCASMIEILIVAPMLYPSTQSI